LDAYTGLELNDGTANSVLNATTLTISDAPNTLSIDKDTITSSGGLDLEAENSITLTSNLLYNINLDAPNINSYGRVLPICFTRETQDNFTYNSATGGSPQQLERVYQTSYDIPFQFVSNTTGVGYTSNYWKIDFALNCYNSTNLGDKGLGMYIDFLDTNSNVYQPITYNLDTPYAVYQTASSYTSPTQTSFQNFNWSDLIDLSALPSVGVGSVPLTFRLWVGADNNFSTNFRMCLTLTRTNLLPP
jgi:hypothetical protein